MRTPTAGFVSMAIFVLVATASGCSDSAESPSAETTSPPDSSSASDSTSSSFPGASAMPGTLTASPNPIQVCDGTGVGVTHLSWSAPVGGAVEVRVGKPDGALFARTGNVGEKDTGKWVGEGARFYLVSASGPGAPPSVLGSTVVHVTKEGCK